MEIRQLKYFVSAATHLNFTKAAKECFIVQSSMTEQIANLENELGVKLFDRQRKGLILTEAGEYFLPRAKAVLCEAQKAADEMSLFRSGYRHYLRIGYLGELFKEDLIKVLRTYRKEFPTTRIALRQLPEEVLIEGLRDGQLDIILIVRQDSLEKEAEWMETKVLATTGAVLVVGEDHPFAHRDSVTTEELKGLTYTNYENEGREELMDALDILMPKEGLSLDPCSNEILIAGGYGVNLWPKDLSETKNYPNLRFVPLADYPIERDFLLAWRKEKLSAEGVRFCELMCNERKRDG